MRILFVIHQFFPEFQSGTERVTLNLARNLQRAGHYVHVLTCAVDPARLAAQTDVVTDDTWLNAVYQGVPVTFLPRAELPATAEISLDTTPRLVEQLTAWMQRERFDVAHIMHTMRMCSAVLAIQRCALPYVVTLTDFFLPCARINLITLNNRLCTGPEAGHRCVRDCQTAPWTEQAYLNRHVQARSLLQVAGERVAPSNYVASRLREAFPGMDFRVLAHGIDMLALAGAATQVHAQRGHGQLKLAFVGTIIPQKGLDVLLKALALMPSRDLRLKVIGGFHGGPTYHDQVRTLAAADPRVELLGQMDAPDVFACLEEVDLLCLPSIVPESYSLVLHEACAAGVPALVSNLGAPADHVASYGSGRAVAVGNPAAWADAIAAVAESPETLQQLRQKLPVPLRVEEEAFFYESLYRRLRRDWPP